MNPFSAPERVFISSTPQDMRAGIDRLAQIVASEMGDPADGALYVFISRDCTKAKMLLFQTNGWCLYYVKLCEGGFQWKTDGGARRYLKVDRRELIWLLEGLSIHQPEAHKPLAAHGTI